VTAEKTEEGSMTEAEALRQRAAECARMASTARDPVVEDDLRRMARRYAERANELENPVAAEPSR
jgi:hypothetical protein